MAQGSLQLTTRHCSLAGIHEQEAASTISTLGLARAETSLREHIIISISESSSGVCVISMMILMALGLIAIFATRATTGDVIVNMLLIALLLLPHYNIARQSRGMEVQEVYTSSTCASGGHKHADADRTCPKRAACWSPNTPEIGTPARASTPTQNTQAATDTQNMT